MEVFVKSFDELTKEELMQILRLRCEVFVVEQRCFYPDIDGIDEGAYHVFIKDKGRLEAYLRLYPYDETTAKIGRVVARSRKSGYGSAVMKQGIAAAHEKLGAEKVLVEAQCQAIGFYEKLGFKVISEEFMDAGIPHKKMILEDLS